jgi:hypothetical protein
MFTHNPVLITWRGESLTAYAWAKRLGWRISDATITQRIKKGWSLERVFAKPRWVRRSHVRRLGSDRTLCGRSVFEIKLDGSSDRPRATCWRCMDAVYRNLGKYVMRVGSEDEWLSHARE